MTHPTWQFNEFQHPGVDFDDESQVRQFDENHGNNDDNERELVQSLGIRPGDTVVDVGSGTGSFAIQAALAGARVTAVDVSNPMLQYTRTRADRAGVSALLDVQRAGFLTYAHAGPPADWVVTKFALHHLPDFWKGVALHRLAAVLKPAGRLYIEDVVFSFPPPEHAEHLDRWISTNAAPPGGTGFPRAVYEMHVRQEFSTYTWILDGLLQRAGFRVDSCVSRGPTYASYSCTKLPPGPAILRVR